MRLDNQRQKLFTRRALLLSAGKGLLISSLFARLYYLQAIRGQEYRTLSTNNRVKLRPIAPDRGVLFDRDVQPLALNEENYRVMCERAAAEDIKQRLQRLARIIDVDADSLWRAYERGVRKNSRGAVAVVEHLPWEMVARIEVRLAELANMYVDIGTTRHYPYEEVFSHVLGFVGAIAEDDPQAKKYERLPDLKIGKKGVEKAFDEPLIGKPGVKHVEVNVKGQVVRDLTREPSVPGENLYLSLSLPLQQFIYERLAKEKSASAVVMDAWTGEVLALVSYPGFDPNKFSQGISQKDWNELLHNPHKPLINKAVAGVYPPGSTFKMMTGLAGLEQGVVNASTTFYCPGAFHLGNHRFHCWKREGHGAMNVQTALEQSCDVYFYNVANRIGIDPIADMCRRFGLGEPTGIPIPGEAGGLIPSDAWKRRQYGIPWQKGDSINASIGQGYVLTTPLQLAVMTARLVNGGYAVTPGLLRAEHRAGHEGWKEVPVSRQHLATVVEGMRRVTMNPRGTAYWKRITEPGMEMGGKTGTAQVARLEKSRGSNVPWHYQHHALFVGYAPIHAPRYVCSVVVEHGGGGSATAAPIASEILLKTQQLLQGSFWVPPAQPVNREAFYGE